MKKLFFLSLAVLLLSSCKKEAKTVYVSYKIVETSSYTPTYTVGYSLADGTTKTIGRQTNSKWVSEKISDVEIGKYLSLSVEGTGGGTYEMYIYVNGRLDSQRIAGDGYGRQTLTTQIQY
jgi:hypothetical protein